MKNTFKEILKYNNTKYLDYFLMEDSLEKAPWEDTILVK